MEVLPGPRHQPLIVPRRRKERAVRTERAIPRDTLNAEYPLNDRLPVPRTVVSTRRVCGERCVDVRTGGYFPFFSPYPFHTHSMACGRNCCWALPMPWPCPTQNRY